MRKTLILTALVACSPLFAVEAPQAETAPPATVEQRLAALEAEVAALREQLAPETLAQRIAEEVVAAQRKALEPATPEEAVQQLAEQHGIDAETQAKVTAILEQNQQERETFFTKIRSGEIPRDQIREQLSTMREQHQQELGEHLDEAQLQTLQQAMRPAGAGGRGWGRGGNRGNRGDRGDRGNRGGDGRANF